MTKKDCELIIRAVRRLAEHTTKRSVVMELADAFKFDNLRFDRAKFAEACLKEG